MSDLPRTQGSLPGPLGEDPPPLTDADLRIGFPVSETVPENVTRLRPVVRITTDERATNDAAIAALASDPSVYQRGRALVQVIRGINASRGITRAPGSLTISEVKPASLREKLAAAAHWEQVDAKAMAAAQAATGTGASAAAKPSPSPLKTKRVHPPDWAVKAVASRERWEGIRPLTGVTEWPILRADGTILTEPGYDFRSGLYYEPVGRVDSIPAEPSRGEIDDALTLLREAVCDFPLPDDAAFSAWLAGLLTPLARYAFDGPAPLFLAEANTRGSGKTLLWELVATILSGRSMASTPYAENDDEMAKKITACALAGDPLIFLDNVKDKFGGGPLDQAITGRTWRDRILGQSANTAELPLTAVWYATGNNLLYAGDIDRRLCVCRLESPEERPEDRDGFTHPDLLLWAKKERRRLLAAGLLLLRAFAVAGMPRGSWRPWGSFEGWSRTVKACLEWLGLAAPPAPTAIAGRSSEAEELAAILSALEWADPRGTGLTAGDFLRDVVGEIDSASHERRSIASPVQNLKDVLGTPLLPTPKKLGWTLRRFKGRVFEGRALVLAGLNGGQNHWKVRRSSQVPDSSSDGVAS